MKNFHARPISLEFVKLNSDFFFFNYKMYLYTFPETISWYLANTSLREPIKNLHKKIRLLFIAKPNL